MLHGADVVLSTRKLFGARSLPEADCVGTQGSRGWWHLSSLVQAPGPAGPTSLSPAHHGAQLRDLFCLTCSEQLSSPFSHATVSAPFTGEAESPQLIALAENYHLPASPAAEDICVTAVFRGTKASCGESPGTNVGRGE